MFEEEKVDVETKEETPEEDELNKEKPEGKDKPDGEDNPEGLEEVDYEADLEAEKKRRIKAEGAAQHHREENEELRKNFVTKDELKQLEDKVIRRASRSEVEAEVKKQTRTPKEAELALYHYDNTISPTGDVTTDVRRAVLLANEKKLGAENEELREALRSKENRGQDVRGGRRMEDEAEEPALDPDTQNLIRLNKMTWNPQEKVFKNARGVTYDPKTAEVKDPRRQ